MTNEINFRVILNSIGDVEDKSREILSQLFSSIFHLDAQEVNKIFLQLPVIVFDGLSAERLQKAKESLNFLEKVGFDFTITLKDQKELPRTNWVIRQSASAFSCPKCGEDLVILSASSLSSCLQDISSKAAPHDELPLAASTPPPSLPKPEKKSRMGELGNISAEWEEIEVLSRELEAMGEDEYIEDVEGTSEEIHSFSGEIESLDGISAEFEDINGVSAEFDQIGIDSVEEDVGSLSAELEEIESMSAELSAMDSEDEIEQLDDFLSPGSERRDIYLASESDDYEIIEEIEEMSAELERISEADPLQDTGVQRTFNDSAQKFPPGSFDVMINFSGKGDLPAGTALLAKIQGLSMEKAESLADQRTAIVVATNISEDAAKAILEQFSRLRMPGKIVPSRS